MHEAAQAVAAVIFGHPLERVTLPDGGTAMRFTAPSVPFDALAGQGEDVASPWLIQVLAGSAAAYRAKLHKKSWNLIHIEHLKVATEIVDVAIGSRATISPEDMDRVRGQRGGIVTRAAEGTVRFVERNINSIIAVAYAILSRTTLTGEEVAEIVQKHSPWAFTLAPQR
jgi:hypothetical protein